MKHLSLFLFVIIFLSLIQAAPVKFTENGHWYEFISTGATWTAARDFAAAQTFLDTTAGILYGGHLLTLNSASENTFVLNTFNFLLYFFNLRNLRNLLSVILSKAYFFLISKD